MRQGGRHRLDRMSLGELVVAYGATPAIQVYVGLSVLSGAVVWRFGDGAPLVEIVLPALAAVLLYPLIWYLLHRFVLHGRFLYRSRRTAALWKRIHYDHHRDPNDLEVLFGALYTTLPTIGLCLIPLGWAVGGPAGAASAFAGGLLTTCVYEFVHCIQHLNYKPRMRFLARLKALHLAHHFHNEQGNFGITNFLWDRVLGTYYGRVRDRARSATVFNLGYVDAETRAYPWVALLSQEDGAADAPPARR